MYDYYDDYGYYDDYSAGFDVMDMLSGAADGLKFVLGIISFVGIVIGLIQCFGGYKLIRFTISVHGFIFGSTIGAAIGIICMAKASSAEIGGMLGFIIFLMLIFGIIGAAVSFNVYQIGIFVIGFSGVYAVSFIISIIGSALSDASSIWPALIISIIPAAVAGYIVVKFNRPIIIIYTAICGAFSAAAGIADFLNGGMFIIFIALSIGGIYYQIKSNGGLKDTKPTTVSQSTSPSPSQSPIPNPRPQPVSVTPSPAPRPAPPQTVSNELPQIID